MVEIEVIKLVCEELTNQEIAEKLGIKYNTVIEHRKNIREKLDIHNTAGLIKFAYTNEIIK